MATVVVGTPTAARAAAWDIDWISETPFFGRQDSIAWDVAVQPDGGQIEVGEYGGDAFVLRYDPRLGRTEGFEGAGIAVLDAGGDERAYGVALQPDGAVVVAGQADGDVALWRLRPDGVSDGEFGTEGMARVDLGTDDDAAHAVAVLLDGRIVVAGWNGSDLALVRFTSVGALDPSFGSGGRVVTDLGSEEWAEAMAVTSTGSVVVAGGKGEDSLVARFSSAGTLDPTFGSGGTFVVDIGDADVARDVTLDAAEQPVLAGVTGASAYVARLTTTGAFDATFAGDGSVETELRGTPAEANGVVALADGRIVIAGRTGNDAAIAAFLPTGLPDPDFSDGNAAWSSVHGASDTVLYGLAVAVDGTLATAGWEPSHYAHRTLQPLAGRYGPSGYVYNFGREQLDLERYERANDLVLQPDGRSVSVATIGQGGHDAGDIGVARHLPGGELDPSFGGDGRVILDYVPSADAADAAAAVALQPDGKVLVAGWAACHTGVVRLLPDGSPDPSFGTDGWVRLDTDPGGSCRLAEDIAVASDGDVLITVGLASGPVVMRLTPAGSVDTSWAHGGTAEVPDVIGIPSSLVVQGDGSLLVAGDGAIGVARLQPSGDIDASFGVAGVARIDTGLQDVYVDELVVRPDGRILAAGGYYSGDYSFAVAQWNASGAPDAAFGGGDGWVTTDFY
ncbi:MAG: hypothetical protein M3P34_08735, partial [Actinomycetota bacterium]|nr:hypothetical protein [Actinomycetota bacterium]